MKFFTITATIVSALAATATAAPVADDSAKSVHEDFVRATQAMDEFIASNVKHMKRTDDLSVKRDCDWDGFDECMAISCDNLFCPPPGGGCGVAKTICIEMCKKNFGPGC